VFQNFFAESTRKYRPLMKTEMKRNEEKGRAEVIENA